MEIAKNIGRTEKRQGSLRKPDASGASIQQKRRVEHIRDDKHEPTAGHERPARLSEDVVCSEMFHAEYGDDQIKTVVRKGEPVSIHFAILDVRIFGDEVAVDLKPENAIRVH